MIDRYTKVVLTIIAGALIYLCIVFTVFPAVQAQGTRRAGEMITAPIETVIVGWRATEPMPVASPAPLRIVGTVETERTKGVADRVVLVGWEEDAAKDRAARMQPIADQGATLPVRIVNR